MFTLNCVLSVTWTTPSEHKITNGLSFLSDCLFVCLFVGFSGIKFVFLTVYTVCWYEQWRTFMNTMLQYLQQCGAEITQTSYSPISYKVMSSAFWWSIAFHCIHVLHKLHHNAHPYAHTRSLHPVAMVTVFYICFLWVVYPEINENYINEVIFHIHIRTMKCVLDSLLIYIILHYDTSLYFNYSFNVCVRPLIEYCSPVWSPAAVWPH